MDNKILLIIITSILFSLNVFGQNNEIEVSVIDEGVTNVKYLLYTPQYKAFGILKSQDEALNQTPESLAESIMSANNQEWVNHNQHDGKGKEKSDRFFARVKSRNPQKTFSSLEAKLSFDYDGYRYALIKFRINLEHYKNRQVTGCYLFVYDRGRWYVTSHLKDYGWLLFTLAEINPKALEALLKKETSISPHVASFLGKITIENQISLKLLYEEYSKLSYDKNRDSTYKYFSEDMGW